MTDQHRHPLDDQVIALAGVAQAAKLVDMIAHNGNCPQQFLEASVHSLFCFEPSEAVEVFGTAAGVKLGLQTLGSLFGNDQQQDTADIVRYAFALLYLERKFSSDADMMSVVRSRLEHTNFRTEHFQANAADICHSVSGIYQDTFSHLKFRIRVTGNAAHLQDSHNADTVRALLLAGIRAAHLWRQLGGRRWKLLFQRRSIQRRAHNLSRNLELV